MLLENLKQSRGMQHPKVNGSGKSTGKLFTQFSKSG
jgi:hypothetical protein